MDNRLAGQDGSAMGMIAIFNGDVLNVTIVSGMMAAQSKMTRIIGQVCWRRADDAAASDS
jgi:hypothetical protein